MVRRLLPPAAILGVAALLRVAFDPWYLNYDARYALIWARDEAHGLKPDFTAAFAPTPHPLENAVSVFGVPFGDQVMVWVILLCFGAVAYVTYLLGRELWSVPVGLVAAVTVATRPQLLRDALLGYQDVAFALLILIAVLLEARRPRRGWPVVALLAVAGLMRPEAWLLSGLYVLYVRRNFVPLAALALVSPALWVLNDAIVTGDALHSLHGTHDLAIANGRRRTLDIAPYWTAKYFGSTLREPLAIGVPIGLAFAWAHRDRKALLPLAVAGAMVVVFMAGPIFGLPLIGRYVRTPAILVALFYGLAVFGWQLDRRRAWKIAGAIAALASVVFLPWHAGMIRDLHTRFERDGALYRDLRDAAVAIQSDFDSCGAISAADHRPIPYLRWWLHGDPGSVNTIEAGGKLQPMLIVPRATPRPKRFYRQNLPHVTAPRGYHAIYENASWRVYAATGCG